MLLWLVGPAVIALGLVLMSTVGRRRYAERVRTTGTVLRWDHARVGGFTEHGKQRSVPVLEFTTQDGRPVEAAARWAADRGVYRTGQAAEVFYDPADPEDIRVELGWLDKPFMLVVVAGVFLTVLTIVVPLLFSRLG